MTRISNYSSHTHTLIFAISIIFGILLSSCHSSRKIAEKIPSFTDDPIYVPGNQSSNSKHKITEEALSWLGTPYAYAKSEKNKGTDCSGMVLRVYQDVLGYKLPRNSAKQAEFCKPITIEEVETGDLVFFATSSDPSKITHVGIMLDKHNFVHASSRRGVVTSSIDTPYYTQTFRMFGRVKNP